MTIGKTMLLKEDLKVHADYEHSGIYNRFTPEQKKELAERLQTINYEITCGLSPRVPRDPTQ